MIDIRKDETRINAKVKLSEDMAKAYWDAVYEMGNQANVIKAALECYLKQENYLPNDEWFEYDFGLTC